VHWVGKEDDFVWRGKMAKEEMKKGDSFEVVGV